MSIKCKNCESNPATDSTVVLRRINPFGVTGEWMCQECLDCMELFEGKPHYVHSKSCPNYCDYACAGQAGFDLAEQIHNHLKP